LAQGGLLKKQNVRLKGKAATQRLTIIMVSL